MSSKKYSVSLPEELAEDVRTRVGHGGFSAYVASALEQQVAMDKLGEIVDDYVQHRGPLSAEDIEAARQELAHHENGSSGNAA